MALVQLTQAGQSVAGGRNVPADAASGSDVSDLKRQMEQMHQEIQTLKNKLPVGPEQHQLINQPKIAAALRKRSTTESNLKLLLVKSTMC